MAKFTVHTAVHGERGTEFFKPGDEVPEWAVGKVGDHVTDAGRTEPEADMDEDSTEADADKAEDTKAPDFTAPRRQTRARRK